MRLLPLTLLVICFSVKADWKPLGVTNGNHYFADWETVEKIGATKRIWVLRNDAKVKKDRVLSTTTLVEIYCREKKIKILEQYWHTEHFGEGENVTPKKFEPDANGFFPRPQSPLYNVVLKVCKK